MGVTNMLKIYILLFIVGALIIVPTLWLINAAYSKKWDESEE